jgi:hypothetical protein
VGVASSGAAAGGAGSAAGATTGRAMMRRHRRVRVEGAAGVAVVPAPSAPVSSTCRHGNCTVPSLDR